MSMDMDSDMDSPDFSHSLQRAPSDGNASDLGHGNEDSLRLIWTKPLPGAGVLGMENSALPWAKDDGLQEREGALGRAASLEPEDEAAVPAPVNCVSAIESVGTAEEKAISMADQSTGSGGTRSGMFRTPADLGGASEADTDAYKTFIEMYAMPIYDAYAECKEKGRVKHVTTTVASQPSSMQVPVLYMKKGYPNRDQGYQFYNNGPGFIIIDYTTKPDPTAGIEYHNNGTKTEKFDISGPASGTTKTFQHRSVCRYGGSSNPYPGEKKQLKMWVLDISPKADPNTDSSGANKKRKAEAQEFQPTSETRFSLCYLVEISVKPKSAQKKQDKEGAPQAQEGGLASTTITPNETQPGQPEEDKWSQQRDAFLNKWAPELKTCLVRYRYYKTSRFIRG
jgi:hypothetical protein